MLKIKKLLPIILIIFLCIGFTSLAQSIFYLDYENGDDVNDGSDWANAWKTLTLGATAARIAPGDIIRIAKSPAPTSIGNGTWTNLSKTVTLATAGTAVIDLCETAWTAGGGSDCTVSRTTVSTNGKQGSYSMKFTLDAAVQASILQAYYPTGELDLSSYQKISFWIYNSGVIVADNWIVNLCSDVAGADVVDSFLIPAIPIISLWQPLTLARVGGGNLGASIKSIAVYSGATTTGMASKYLYVDNFIACTTNGLNLQSLISKNSAEQGGAEGWYGIQSINGVTVNLDNGTATKGNTGQGYATSGTTLDTVTTYKRETIKTEIPASISAPVQEITEGGTLGNEIEFQGGYNITTTIQEGETFFDGLKGAGYGIYATGKDFFTLNFLNTVRYYSGLYINLCDNITIINFNNTNNNSNLGFYLKTSFNAVITNLGNINNNTSHGFFIDGGGHHIISLLSNVNNNLTNGLRLDDTRNNIISTISNVNNNNGGGGIYFFDEANNNILALISNANYNAGSGVYFGASINNIIRWLSTKGNATSGVYANVGSNYLNNLLAEEATEVSAPLADYYNYRIYSNNHDQDTTLNKIFTDGGLISSEATDRSGGTGIMWKLAVTSATRNYYYPLKLSIAKIAVVADKLVTVKAYMKKSHATNIGAMLVCSGGQLTGISVANIIDTKADDTDWEELEITFTPTQAGVVEIEAWAYYAAANGDVYVEDMTITQAD